MKLCTALTDSVREGSTIQRELCEHLTAQDGDAVGDATDVEDRRSEDRRTEDRRTEMAAEMQRPARGRTAPLMWTPPCRPSLSELSRAEKGRFRDLAKSRFCLGADTSLTRWQGVSGLDPRPKFSNRAGCGWGEGVAPCECALWPGWIQRRLQQQTGAVEEVQTAPNVDDNTLQMSDPMCKMWRPGGKHMRYGWWYSEQALQSVPSWQSGCLRRRDELRGIRAP